MIRLLALVAIALMSQGCAGPRLHAGSGMLQAPDGLSLHYQVDVGPGEPIIVLHGGPGLSAGYLRPDLARLAARHTLIFYDQRGAGYSSVRQDGALINLEKHIEDLDLVRRHFGLQRVTLFGHSWGAALAAHYAIRYPQHVRRMLLVGPMIVRNVPYMAQFDAELMSRMDEPTRRRFETLQAATADADDPIAACREFWALFIHNYLSKKTQTTQFRGDACAGSPQGVANTDKVWELTLLPLGDFDWRGELASVQVPTLIVLGDEDPIPAQSAIEWAQALPRARLLTIPDSGHFPYVEQPDVFYPAIEAFLR